MDSYDPISNNFQWKSACIIYGLQMTEIMKQRRNYGYQEMLLFFYLY